VVGAYTASIVLASMALVVLFGMQLFQSGRLRRAESNAEEPKGLALGPVPAVGTPGAAATEQGDA